MKTILLFLNFVVLSFCRILSVPDLQQLDHSEGIFIDPDVYRNVSELISSKNYPVTNYDVTTKDGYILTVQNIPNGRNNWNYHKGQKKEVVLMQHGLISSSADFVINFPNESLGFLLADAGYDVWLGNVRGNTYARRHVKYDIDSDEFWNFSYDEMALEDLPAMIDYILQKTGQEKLYYIGHSQGTTIAYAMLSEKPEYNDKIKLFMGLGPAATVGYISSPIRYLAPFTDDIASLAKLIGVRDFLPSGEYMDLISEFVCDTRFKVICENVVFVMCGTDTSNLNLTRLHVYAAHTPAGTSAKNMVHWGQAVNSKVFQKFDYGKEKNLIYYNQTTPPQYNVENIKAPVALFWSRNDLLADPTDVGLLEPKLKTLVKSYLVPLPIFNHMDFSHGYNVVDVLYKELFKLMSEF